MRGTPWRAAGLDCAGSEELAERAAKWASYAGRLLADMGADVIKVEPPGGDPIRRLGPFRGDQIDLEGGGLFLELNLNKWGVTVSLEDVVGRARLLELLATADVLLDNTRQGYLADRGFDIPTLQSLYPGLVVVSVTPFGQTGPMADYQSCELVSYSAGGLAYVTPQYASDGETPLKAPERHVEFMAGMNAALAAVAALRLRDLTGRGQHADVSEQETAIEALHISVTRFTYDGEVPTRVSRPVAGPSSVFPCSDGYVYIICPEEHQWEALVRVMGNPDWAQQEWCRDRFARGENWDAVQALIEDWTRQHAKQELFERCAEGRVVCAPLFSADEVLKLPQYQARGFHVPVKHPVAGTLQYPGPPFRLANSADVRFSPAPLLGQHNASAAFKVSSTHHARRRVGLQAGALALDGVRVVEISNAWAGPYCGMVLAELGADVVRVESASRPDIYRTTPSRMQATDPRVGAASFHAVNRGKRSLTVDLHRPDSVALVKRLIALSDVVLENFAPRVMLSLGLGYQSLLGVRPDLIMASLSGYGHTGPLSHYPAYGGAVWAYAGLGLYSGHPGRPPQWLLPVSDPMVALTAAFAIVSALRRRERTGLGEFIDLPQAELLGQIPVEALMDWQMNGRQRERQGNRDRVAAPHGIYRCCGDDRWIAIACFDDAEWLRLRAALGDPEWAQSPMFDTAASRRAHANELDRHIEEWTREHEPSLLVEHLQALGVRAGQACDMRDLFSSPHLRARGFFVDVEQPGVGLRTYAGLPFELRDGGAAIRRPSPVLGEHNPVILNDLLGLTEDQYSQLEAMGAIR